VSAAPVVIAHVSDLHLGAHDPVAVDTLPADVAAARPTLTVVTGDITMRARVGEFQRAVELVARLPGPRLVVPGNHDVPLDLVVSRFARPYARYRAAFGTDGNTLLRLPGVTALGLNSMPRWRWKNGRVSGRQAAAVVATLGPPDPGAVEHGPVRLLALHHPPFARGSARLVGRTGLVAALVDARVDLVLAGHVHIPRTRAVDLAHGGRGHRLVEVVAGTATSRRTRGVGRSWSLIVVDDRAVEVRERHQCGDGWRTVATARFER
jgi:3',5'-cyclic AMP phosphodiesterase CpdA